MTLFYCFPYRRRDEKSQKGHTIGDRRVPVPEHDRLLRRGCSSDVNVALLFSGTKPTVSFRKLRDILRNVRLKIFNYVLYNIIKYYISLFDSLAIYQSYMARIIIQKKY